MAREVAARLKLAVGELVRGGHELVQRDGGYRGYGARNAPVRLAAQHASRPVR
ncbi:hypothetical protein ACU639_30840 [Streptomyces cynarae]|uniref:hypothetical protein n=1 Tax=Streptomyces cynarae TaxID=2981134 RepID=UPI00406CD17E